MFKLSLAFSAASLVASQAAGVLTDYCAALETSCPEFDINATVCGMAFATIPVGTVNDTDVNSIGCRQKFLTEVAWNSTADRCRFSGATGGGLCGDVLDAVCQISTTICSGVAEAAYPDKATCKTGLMGIAHQWGSVQGPNSGGGQNSLECRVYHAIASTKLGSAHCGHFIADVNSSLPCIGAVPSNATRYCENLQYQCGAGVDTNAQFAKMEQCVQVAAGYPKEGDSQATNQLHSLGCREYHAQAARADPNTHCEHAGPTGGAACGTRQAAWASILAAAPCNDSHVTNFFAMINSSKMVDTLVPPGFSTATPYSTSYDTGKNTQACRIYHLGVASTDTSHCAHGAVSGGDNCGKLTSNLCGFIGQVCGFGSAKWQFADNATCATALSTGLTTGVTSPVWDPANNTYECRFYHASVAASFQAGGLNSGASNALTSYQLHCSHVLKPAAAGGCGVAAASPTAAPANSAASLSLGVSAIVVSVFFL